MALNNTINATTILNRVAAEVGQQPIPDPLATQDLAFVKMQYLLNTAGEELMQAYPWELLVRDYSFTTGFNDSGEYALPADFGYMLNQTNWERTNRLPMRALDNQTWAYLKGRDLGSSTIYASFRIAEGKYNIYPTPPPEGLEVNFQYITSNWVWDGNEVNPVYKSEVTMPTDVPLFDRTLITRALKCKWLESNGFDSTKAQADYNQIFAFLTGHDTAAPVLNMGRRGRQIPMISGDNVPITGFGL